MQQVVQYRRLGAQVNQPRRPPHCLAGHRWKAKPARVGRNRTVQGAGHVAVDGPALAFGEVEDHRPRRLGLDLLELNRPQLVGTCVMIDHDLDRGALFERLSQLGQLHPGTGVENHMHIGFEHGLLADLRGVLLAAAVRVDELQPAGNRRGVRNPHLFAQVLEQSGEPELRTKRIGVGTHVRGENELLVSPNQVGEGIPIDRHVARISPTGRFGHRWPLWAGGTAAVRTGCRTGQHLAKHRTSSHS